MKAMGLLLLTALILSACGSNDSSDGMEPNLFLISTGDYTASSKDESLFGLWESDEYEDNGVTNQIRWQIKENRTVLAKKCTHSSGATYFVQVSVALSEDFSEMANLTPYSIPVKEETKTTDVQLMAGNKPCRISIDPAKVGDSSVVDSSTSEFELAESDFSDGEMSLHFSEENREGKLTKISGI